MLADPSIERGDTSKASWMSLFRAERSDTNKNAGYSDCDCQWTAGVSVASSLTASRGSAEGSVNDDSTESCKADGIGDDRSCDCSKCGRSG